MIDIVIDFLDRISIALLILVSMVLFFSFTLLLTYRTQRINKIEDIIRLHNIKGVSKSRRYLKKKLDALMFYSRIDLLTIRILDAKSDLEAKGFHNTKDFKECLFLDNLKGVRENYGDIDILELSDKMKSNVLDLANNREREFIIDSVLALDFAILNQYFNAYMRFLNFDEHLDS